MSALSPLQRAAMIRMQRKFKAAANTHGPLRCVLIHKQGADMDLKLSPPASECMPDMAGVLGTVYGGFHRKFPELSMDELLGRTTTTIDVNALCMRFENPPEFEAFAVREVYLLRECKEATSCQNAPPEVLLADPRWMELWLRTGQSNAEFRRLAGEAGRCFGRDDWGVLPGVAGESLETDYDELRWLWVVFDLAWQNVKGSPLQARRWVWHQDAGGAESFYDLEVDFARCWEEECRPEASRDEATQLKRLKRLAFLKDWAKRRPQFYYSQLDDLFSASVQAIDLLTLYEPKDQGMSGQQCKQERADLLRPSPEDMKAEADAHIADFRSARGGGDGPAYDPDAYMPIKDALAKWNERDGGKVVHSYHHFYAVLKNNPGIRTDPKASKKRPHRKDWDDLLKRPGDPRGISPLDQAQPDAPSISDPNNEALLESIADSYATKRSIDNEKRRQRGS